MQSLRKIEVKRTYSNLDKQEETVQASQDMVLKAGLAQKIGEIIKSKKLTQVQAAEILGMPQPKLSNMLRGKFHGISEEKMMSCLVKLGRDVHIVVSNTTKKAAKIELVFS